MSCRKFDAPRHGSLAYCPMKRASSIKQQEPKTPKDNPTDKPHLTSFLSYKVGMTHILRISSRKTTEKKKEVRKEIVDAVTLLEAPPMKVFGVRSYVRGINGLVLKNQVFSNKLDESVKSRLIHKFKKKKNKEEKICQQSPSLDNFAMDTPASQTVLRVLAHTQINLLKLNCKKAHILEITVNGGTLTEKLEFIKNIFERTVTIGEVFSEQELISISGVTKGKGFTGVVKRRSVSIQPRKSRKGIRKVACIGAWHPAGVLRTVARAGQKGTFCRTMINKKVVKIGNGEQKETTDYDLTEKTINPMGGFLHYGYLKNDYLMIKGNVMGPSKRVITIGKSYNTTNKERNLENVDIKFIDTSSKMGHGRFQTSAEKAVYYSK